MDDEQPITMTLATAAKRLDISYAHARDQAAEGRLPGAFRLGRTWRVHRQIFEQEIERLARGETTQLSPDDVLTRAMDEARFRATRRSRTS